MEEGHRPVGFGCSVAVVIGIDKYTHIRPLNTAVSDATRLATLLREQHGYTNVILLTERVTQTRLRAFFRDELPDQVGSNDRLLLYFAGHGIALDGEDGPQGYLIPQDARSEDRNTFLAMADLYCWLEKLPCRHLLGIFDCCFAGAFTWYRRRNLRPLGDTLYREHYDRFVREPAWQILTSAAYDQEALDVVAGKPIGERGELSGAGERHSPFAQALFDALAGAGDLIPKGGGDGVVTATELYLYLRQAVEVEAETQANHAQTPELWPFSRSKHGRGEYIFLVPGHGEPELPPAPPLSRQNNPYRGLESYEEEHADLFFGRRALIQSLAAEVAQHPLTVVLGASGTGKSSVVKAGLVPYLKGPTEVKSGDTSTASSPGHLILPPMRPGDEPLRGLAELVAANLPGSSELPGRSEPAAFFQAAMTNWLAAHPHQCLLLIIDQAEELITLCRYDKERADFLTTLATLIDQHPGQMRIVLTLRTDFEPQFYDSPLNGHWRNGRFIVPPMSQSELREVIELPAVQRAIFFDPPELVDRLIDEVIQTPGALPLLSFTLEQLYLKYLDRQEQAQHDGVTLERSLTRRDYDELGGVIGSLRRRAAEVYAGLPDEAHRATMQRVMLRMVAVEGGEVARRRVTLDELVYPSEAENARVQVVLERLVAARLLVKGSTDLDGDGVADSVVEPAHDALVAAWDKLLQWKRQAEESLPLQRRLWQAASEWNVTSIERRSRLLWDTNPRLPQLEETLWPTHNKENGFVGRMRWVRQVLWPQTGLPVDTQWLNQAEVRFVQESVKRRASGLRRILIITTFVIIALLFAFVFAEGQRQTAVGEADARATQVIVRITAEAAAVAAEASAVAERDEAQRQARIARAGQLAAQSQTQLADYPQRSLLLALEALELSWRANEPHTREAEQALRDGLSYVSGQGLGGHHRSVNALAISADNHWLATGSADSTVRLWNLRAKNVQSSPVLLAAHEGAITAIDFSPDNRWLATASEDQTVRLWDLQSPKIPAEPVVLRGHREAVDVAKFSPDGRRLFTAGSDSKLIAWDLHKTKPTAEMIDLEQDRSILSLVFSSDSRRFFTASVLGHVRMWDNTAIDLLNASTLIHQDAGHAVSLSPDSRWLATIGSDLGFLDAVYLWEVGQLAEDPTAVQPIILGGHNGNVNTIAFTPDSRRLMAGSSDSNLRIWDLTEADPSQSLLVLKGHTGPVLSVMASPDSRWLASGGEDRQIRLWDLLLSDPGAGGFILNGHEDAVSSIAISSDGRWLASGSSPGSVALLRSDRQTNFQIAEGGADATARLWDLTLPDPSNSSVVRRRSGGRTSWGDVTVLHHQDNSPIAVADQYEDVGLWLGPNRADLDASLATVITLPGSRTPAALSPDGQWLATNSVERRLLLWKLTESSGLDKPFFSLNFDDAVSSLVISPDSRWLAAANKTETVSLWLLSDDTPLRSYTLSGGSSAIGAVFISPDNRWLVAGGIKNILGSGYEDKKELVYLWSLTETGLAAPALTLEDAERWLWIKGFSPDGRFLITHTNNDVVQVWDLHSPDPSLHPVYLDDHSIEARADLSLINLAISPDSRWMLTWTNRLHDNNPLPRLWNLNNLSNPATIITGHEGAIEEVAFSSDGRWLVTGSGSPDQSIRMWDLTKPTVPGRYLGHHDRSLATLVISPDSRWLLSTSHDHTALLWHLDAPEIPPRLLRGHENAVTGAAFSHSGQWLLTIGADARAMLWDLKTIDQGPLPHYVFLRGHQDWLRQVYFSADDQWVITADSSGRVVFTNMNVLGLAKQACLAVGRSLTQAERDRFSLEASPCQPCC
jgi:WD40 repeat protein